MRLRDFIASTPPAGQLALKQEYDMVQRKITKELTDLKLVLESSAPVKRLTPAFEWCQSTESVFMNVKFAHKLDAPATLNVEASNVTIGDQRVHLEASNGAGKHFHLSIPLFCRHHARAREQLHYGERRENDVHS